MIGTKKVVITFSLKIVQKRLGPGNTKKSLDNNQHPIYWCLNIIEKVRGAIQTRNYLWFGKSMAG